MGDPPGGRSITSFLYRKYGPFVLPKRTVGKGNSRVVHTYCTYLQTDGQLTFCVLISVRWQRLVGAPSPAWCGRTAQRGSRRPRTCPWARCVDQGASKTSPAGGSPPPPRRLRRLRGVGAGALSSLQAHRGAINWCHTTTRMGGARWSPPPPPAPSSVGGQSGWDLHDVAKAAMALHGLCGPTVRAWIVSVFFLYVCVCACLRCARTTW